MIRKLIHDEHLELSGFDLQVLAESDDDWQVWLNTEVADFDGLCIGCGPTRQDAIDDAIGVFSEGIQALRAGEPEQ